MKKLLFSLFLGLFFLVGCQEMEKPLDEPYGYYDAVSATTSVPIDFTNSGQKRTEHLDHFPLSEKEKFSIVWRLNKSTPVMDFDTFLMIEGEDPITKEKEILWGWGITRKIIDYGAGSTLEIRDFGEDRGIDNDPKRFYYGFEVKSLNYDPEAKKIQMVTLQELYDFDEEKFKTTEITYLFVYAGPVFNYSE